MSENKLNKHFPYTIDDFNKLIVSEPISFLNSNYAGMTFNMWLVGMIANGLCSNPAIYDESKDIEGLSIDLADRIIKKLQEEKDQ